MMDDYPSDWEEDDRDDFDEESLQDECGYDPDFEGICHHITSEHCSFWCPFHSAYFGDDTPAA